MKSARIGIISLIAAGIALTASARPGAGGPRGFAGLFGLEPEELVVAIFDKYDTDENSQLDGTEIAEAAAAKMAERQARREELGIEPPEGFTPPTPEEVAARILERHDEDESGSLDIEEVLQIVDRQFNRGCRCKGRPGSRGDGPRGPRPPADEETTE